MQDKLVKMNNENTSFKFKQRKAVTSVITTIVTTTDTTAATTAAATVAAR